MSLCKRGQRVSNRGRIEALEGHTIGLTNALSEVITTLAELRMALNATCRESEENRRAIEAMKRENNASLERLEKRMMKTNGQRPPPSPNGQRQEAFVDGVETSVTGSVRELPQHEFRRGDRVENNRVIVERWIPNVDQHTRTPSVREEYQDERLEMPQREEDFEAEFEHEHEHEHERPYGRGGHYDRRREHHGRRYDVDHHDERRGNWAYDWGPKRPKVDFSKFNGGDPYE